MYEVTMKKLIEKIDSLDGYAYYLNPFKVRNNE